MVSTVCQIGKKKNGQKLFGVLALNAIHFKQRLKPLVTDCKSVWLMLYSDFLLEQDLLQRFVCFSTESCECLNTAKIENIFVFIYCITFLFVWCSFCRLCSDQATFDLGKFEKFQKVHKHFPPNVQINTIYCKLKSHNDIVHFLII